jgi:hypothetical protein
VERDGFYRFQFNASGVCTSSKSIKFSILKTGDLLSLQSGKIYTDSAGIGGSCAITAYVPLLAGETVGVAQSSSDGATALTVSDAQLFCERISGEIT